MNRDECLGLAVAPLTQVLDGQRIPLEGVS
jgi:hypothetical protein